MILGQRVTAAVRRALCAVCSVAFLSACSTAATPNDGCQDVRIKPGDGGLYVAFGWDSGSHAFDTPVPLLVCVGGGADRRITLTGTPGIAVSPAERTTGGRNEPVRFDVTVTRGSSGRLTYAQYSVASGLSIHAGLSVTVTADASGWRFGKPD